MRLVGESALETSYISSSRKVPRLGILDIATITSKVNN